MSHISITTVGDCSVDRFFEIAEQEADVMCDLRLHECEIAFKYGEKIPARDYTKSFGGSALNTAVSFAKLGAHTHLGSIVGDDRDGTDVEAEAVKNQIDTTYLIKAGKTNQATIIIYKNERTIFSYHSERDYNNLNLPGTNWLYLSSSGRGSDVLVEKVLELAARGTRLAFNPGSWQLKEFEQFKPVVARCEIMIINRDEAETLFDENDPKLQLQRILGLGAKVAIVTDGKNGAYFAASEDFFHITTIAARVIDPTGAGHAFASATVMGLMLSQPLEESIKWGMVNSGSVIESIGSTGGLLNLVEIKNRINDNKIIEITEI